MPATWIRLGVVREFDFRWHLRKMNDFDRLVEAVAGAEGTRLYYRAPAFLESSKNPSE